MAEIIYIATDRWSIEITFTKLIAFIDRLNIRNFPNPFSIMTLPLDLQTINRNQILITDGVKII